MMQRQIVNRKGVPKVDWQGAESMALQIFRYFLEKKSTQF